MAETRAAIRAGSVTLERVLPCRSENSGSLSAGNKVVTTHMNMGGPESGAASGIP